jgi:hypothetical protein
MNWIDYEYPNTACIVEVKYRGDVTITTCRCKDMPKPRDNSRGFTQGFWDHEQATEYARHVAAELGIPTVI